MSIISSLKNHFFKTNEDIEAEMRKYSKEVKVLCDKYDKEYKDYVYEKQMEKEKELLERFRNAEKLSESEAEQLSAMDFNESSPEIDEDVVVHKTDLEHNGIINSVTELVYCYDTSVPEEKEKILRPGDSIARPKITVKQEIHGRQVVLGDNDNKVTLTEDTDNHMIFVSKGNEPVTVLEDACLNVDRSGVTVSMSRIKDGDYGETLSCNTSETIHPDKSITISDKIATCNTDTPHHYNTDYDISEKGNVDVVYNNEKKYKGKMTGQGTVSYSTDKEIIDFRPLLAADSILSL